MNLENNINNSRGNPCGVGATFMVAQEQGRGKPCPYGLLKNRSGEFKRTACP